MAPRRRTNPVRFAVFGAACLLLMAAANAQAPGAGDAGLVSSAALRSDAALLRRTYEALHPGLDRYNTAAEMAQHFADLDRAFDHDQSVSDAFLAFTRYTASIRCGHSYPNFYNQPKAIVAALTGGSDRLPFHFLWIDRQMVVTANQSNDPALVRGTVVERIDGRPTGEILDRMLVLARADGHNDAKRIDSLQVQGRNRFEAFDVYYPLLYPGRSSTIELAVRRPGDASRTTVRVAGITHAQRLTQRTDPAVDPASPLGWTLTFPRADVAVMTMPTWAAYDTTWDWQGFVRSAFETLQARAITHLVVDLRGNEGGSSVGDVLAAHLIDAPLAGEDIVRRTRYRSVPDPLRATLDTWDRSFLDWGDRAIGPDPQGFYRLTKYDDAADGVVIQPAAPRFRGQVDVLVDASNSSATFEFAKLVQSRHLGTLVGAPTGGNLRGINGGAFFFLRLPGSKIEIDVPLIGQFPTVDQPDRGLFPDVAVAPTVADIAAGRDVAMTRAVAGNGRLR